VHYIQRWRHHFETGNGVKFASGGSEKLLTSTTLKCVGNRKIESLTDQSPGLNGKQRTLCPVTIRHC